MKFAKRNQPKAPVATSADSDFGLAECLIGYTVAVENLFAAEAASDEAMGVIENIDQALSSIKQYGVVPSNMSVFDKDGNLTGALGRPALDLVSLESMAAADQKALKAEFIEGLEGLAGDAWKTFKDAVEKIWKAMVDWFKRILSRNEKYKQFLSAEGAVASLKASSSWIDLETTLLKAEDAVGLAKAVANVKGILAETTNMSAAAANGNTADFYKAQDLIGKKYAALSKYGITYEGKSVTVGEFPFKESTGTFKTLGYDGGKAEEIAKAALVLLNDDNLKKLQKSIDQQYSKMAALFGKPEEKEKALELKKIAGECNKIVKFANNCTSKLAFTAYTCVKAARSGKNANVDK